MGIVAVLASNDPWGRTTSAMIPDEGREALLWPRRQAIAGKCALPCDNDGTNISLLLCHNLLDVI